MTVNLPDHLFYSLVDLPHPPQDIIDSVIKTAEENYANGDTNAQFLTRPSITDEQMLQYMSTRLSIIEGKAYLRADYRRYLVEDKVKQWFEENVTTDYNQIGSQLMTNNGGEPYPDTTFGGIFTPHTDGSIRKYVLNYIIKNGSDKAENLWLSEPHKKLVREGEPIQFPDSESLKVIKSVILPERSWCMLYGKIIHTVRNLQTNRIQISVGFSQEQFDKLREKFKIDLKNYG